MDATSARKLYKCLLPSALLELHQYYSHQLAQKQGTTAVELSTVATDLAPLAYQARVAAKLYARERCRLPARVAANLYDGFRSWRRYGKFNCQGMSYQQVWEKYAAAIGDEADSTASEEVTAAKIGLKIMERACATNPMVDSLVLSEKQLEESESKNVLTAQELKSITRQLEQDVQNLLFPVLLEEATAGLEEEWNAPPAIALDDLARYKVLRQLARMKYGLNRLSSPFAAVKEKTTATTTTTPRSSRLPARTRPWEGRQRRAV